MTITNTQGCGKSKRELKQTMKFEHSTVSKFLTTTVDKKMFRCTTRTYCGLFGAVWSMKKGNKIKNIEGIHNRD